MTRAWILPVLLVPCGAVVATALLSSGTLDAAAALPLVFVLLAGPNSPLVVPKSLGASEEQHLSAVDGRPIVYWRPGCKYCLRLRIRLGCSARQLHWVGVRSACTTTVGTVSSPSLAALTAAAPAGSRQMSVGCGTPPPAIA
ncbi:hypothetical protein ABZ923_01255 [Streptomyces sp. NPDC046881]|uniref:hypothetical protein n=1 Tax=Streptomyces sp. NPDC046881 TaxID=3155374 RepID=UPI0033EAA9BC